MSAPHLKVKWSSGPGERAFRASVGRSFGVYQLCDVTGGHAAFVDETADDRPLVVEAVAAGGLGSGNVDLEEPSMFGHQESVHVAVEIPEVARHLAAIVQ